MEISGEKLNPVNKAPQINESSGGQSRVGRLKGLRDKVKTRFSEFTHKQKKVDSLKLAALPDSDDVLTPKENQTIFEIQKNVSFVEDCVKKISAVGKLVKDNPAQIAQVLIPSMLGAIAMLVDTPIPPDILTKASLATGGAFIGAGRVEGVKKKAVAALAGAAIGVGATELTAHAPQRQTAELVSNYVDDVPAIASVAAQLGKSVSKRIK